MKKTFLSLSAILLAAALLFGGCAKQPNAQKLPEVVTLSSYPATIGEGARSVALAEALNKAGTMKIRVQPGDTDVAMVAPLQSGEAEFLYHTGATAYKAAVGDFKDLGPVQIQRVWNGYPFQSGFVVRGDSGFKSFADLKGKKIPQIPGVPAWNTNLACQLAFGGLTLKDVEVVTSPSVTAAIKAFVEGSLDGIASAPSSFVEAAASRHGITWLQLPANDTEGWKRLRAVQPVFNPISFKGAPGTKEGEVLQLAGYEQGVWSSTKISDDIVYAFMKAMRAGYDNYAAADAVLKSWTWERAYSLEGLIANVPYHAGAVKFFKEAGVWTPEHDKFQQAALKAEKDRLGK